MEISGAIGTTLGPFIGSSLNYMFGYEGPFIVFAVLYLNIFGFLIAYIPSDQKLSKAISKDNLIDFKNQKDYPRPKYDKP